MKSDEAASSEVPEGAAARHAEVDSLPYDGAMRRKIWWQITIFGVLAAVVAVYLFVNGVLYDNGTSVGLAVLAVVFSAPCLYASVFRRRDRLAGKPAGS